MSHLSFFVCLCGDQKLQSPTGGDFSFDWVNESARISVCLNSDEYFLQDDAFTEQTLSEEEDEKQEEQ